MINAGAYGAFYLDKQRARRRLYRISENSLLMLALLGGSPGSIFAQQQLRHKTQKQPFATILVCILGLQIGICIAMASTWWL
jgi:uncharacterized membrane protein YsdA (DUF1294 family)